MAAHPILLLSLCSVIIKPAQANFLSYNATTDRNQVDCIYPISGQYGLLSRLLFYCELLFAVLNRKQDWLIAGALASALTYSGTAAIHALVIAKSLPLQDLDCYGIYSIVSAGAIAVGTFFDWSETLRESPARPVFRYCGLLMIAGSICSIVTMARHYSSEAACHSTVGGVMLSAPAQLVGQSGFNCTYTCFGTRQVLRKAGDIVVVAKRPAFSTRLPMLVTSIVLTVVFGCIIGLPSLLCIPKLRTKAEMSALVHEYTKQVKIWKGGLEYSKYARQDRRSLARARKEKREAQKPHKHGFCSILRPVIFVTVVVLNEIVLLVSPAIPTSEPPSAVGQWSPWVAVVLALVASGITRHYRPQFLERQKMLKEEREEREEERLRKEEQVKLAKERAAAAKAQKEEQVKLAQGRTSAADANRDVQNPSANGVEKEEQVKLAQGRTSAADANRDVQNPSANGVEKPASISPNSSRLVPNQSGFIVDLERGNDG